MNENARKWVEALRSGEFDQTCLRLHRVQPTASRPAGYCCLGVACEVYRRETGQGRWGGDEFHVDREIESHALPNAVMEWLSLSSPSGDYDQDLDDGSSLVDQNDHDMPFVGIADIIESEPKGLFR